MLIGSAAVANIRRIQRYLEGTMKAEKPQNTAPGQGENASEQPGGSIFASVEGLLGKNRPGGFPRLVAAAETIRELVKCKLLPSRPSAVESLLL